MCMVAGHPVVVPAMLSLLLCADRRASLCVAFDRWQLSETGRRVPAFSPAGRVAGAFGRDTRQAGALFPRALDM